MSILVLLEAAKEKIESLDPVPSQFLKSQGNLNGFEKLFPVILNQIKSEGILDFEYEQYYGQHFPDLDINLDGKIYGIELKSRNDGSFNTNGNSVFEGISSKNHDEIYVFFGSHKKNDPNPTIKVQYKPYWEVTSSIVVTHSPRFKINMNSETSVFKSSNEYYSLRNLTESEKVDFLQDYLRNNVEGTKWFISSEKENVKPIYFNSLSKSVRDKVICETLILYPQDLLKTIKAKEQTQSNYNRAAEYLLSHYFYYSTSLRDSYSSGGKWKFGSGELPQVFKIFKESKEIFHDILTNSSQDFKNLAYESWSALPLNLDYDFQLDYYKILDYIGANSYPETLEQAKLKKLSDLLN